jgi:hypothetical protein
MIELMTLPFIWIAVLGFIGVVFAIVSVERGNTIIFSIALGALLIGLQLFSDIKAITYIRDNPMNTILFAMGYLAIGVCYLWVKWYYYLHSEYQKHNAVLRTNRVVMATQEKERIFGWIFYWPFSAFWTVLDNPICRIFNGIYDLIGNSLQRMSDRIAKEYQAKYDKYDKPM